MIITITGKPCSGKGTVSKLFCNNFYFKRISTGDMFREYAKKLGYNSILEFQQKYEKIEEIDSLIDKQTEEIGKTQLNENIVIDSRLAWHFIPNSFKVFIDVDWKTAGERLINANRKEEQAIDINTAINVLKDRWQEENERYLKLYNTDNLNPKNYNLVISSSNLTPEQVSDIIFKEYQKFMRNA